MVAYRFLPGVLVLDHHGTINGKGEDKTDSFATVGSCRYTAFGQAHYDIKETHASSGYPRSCSGAQISMRIGTG